MRRRPLLPLLVLLMLALGVLTSCGDDGDDASGNGGDGQVTAPDGDGGESSSDGDDASGGDDGSSIEDIDTAEEIEAELERIEEMATLCEALPPEEVDALLTEALGAAEGPLVIRNDGPRECYLEVGGGDGRGVGLSEWDKSPEEFCGPSSGVDAAEVVEGIGDGISCRQKGGYRSSSALLFSAGGTDYQLRVTAAGEAWDGDILNRSEAAWGLIESIASLAADNVSG